MPNFANYFGDMFGGMDFSSLYGNMATCLLYTSDAADE